MTVLGDLPERSAGLLFMLQEVTHRYRQTAIPPVVDEEVRQAAEAYAATLETADRGIIYEHVAASLTAQRLMTALKAAVRELGEQVDAPGLERDAARALRRMERAAREARQHLGESGTAYLDLIARLQSASAAPGDSSPPASAERGEAGSSPPPSRIILP